MKNNKIIDLAEINTNSPEGKLAFAAIGLFSAHTDKTKVRQPNDVIKLLNDFFDIITFGNGKSLSEANEIYNELINK